MHEYLFRGKRIDNGEWVEGYYLYRGEECSKIGTDVHYIVTHDLCGFSWHEVIPETVGQYTGLTDKNGKKIFEGDIIRYVNLLGKRVNAFVKIDITVASWMCESFYKDKEQGFLSNWIGESGGYVIGNIHDNPELLKGGDGNA